MNKEELRKEAEEKYFSHKMAEFNGFYPRHYYYYYYYLGYLDSAEPREKCIEELDKEIVELKSELLNLRITQIKDLERKIASQRGTIRVYNNKLKSRLEQVERLKQENKELREEIRTVKQLAKAKSIIKDLFSVLPKENIEGVYEVTEEAEQFLREVEK